MGASPMLIAAPAAVTKEAANAANCMGEAPMPGKNHASLYTREYSASIAAVRDSAPKPVRRVIEHRLEPHLEVAVRRQHRPPARRQFRSAAGLPADGREHQRPG